MAKWNRGGEENQGVGRIAASGDRAGGASPLSPQAVSTEGAHPLRDADFDELERRALAATVTSFDVVKASDGIMISWGDDPLDFIWQTDAQAKDLAAKLLELVE